MIKKFICVIFLLLSLCGCNIGRNINEFNSDMYDFINYYESQEYNNLTQSVKFINDDKSVSGPITYKIDMFQDKSHIQYYDHNNSEKPVVIIKEDNQYVQYAYKDYLVDKTIVSENEMEKYRDIDKIYYPSNYYGKIKKQYGEYVFDMKFSRLKAADKKSVKQLINTSVSFQDFSYDIERVAFYYGFRNNEMTYKINIDLKFEHKSQIFDSIDNELTQYCSLIIENNFSCNEFELFDYSDYLLREDAYSNKTIENARKIDNIEKDIYISEGDNYFHLSIGKGLYSFTRTYSAENYFDYIYVSIFNKNKKKIPSYFNESLVTGNTRWSSYFYIEEDGEYYINVNNIAHVGLVRIVKLDLNLPTNENYGVDTKSLTLNSKVDYAVINVTCEENSFFAIKNNTEAQFDFYYDNVAHPVFYACTEGMVLEKGIYEFVVFNSHDSYPLTYNIEIFLEPLVNPNYGEYSTNINDLPKLSEQYSDRLLFLDYKTEKYLSFECLESGYYMLKVDYLHESWRDHTSHYYCLFGEESYIEVNKQGIYLEEGNNYLFRIVYFGNNLIKFKLIKLDEVE